MGIILKVVFIAKKDDDIVCFKHAVERANKGEEIQAEVDDGNTFWSTTCKDCYK